MSSITGRAGRLTDILLAAGWAGVGAVTCALAVVAMYAGAVPAPYWDQWGYTDPAEYLKHMMARHNEHPLVLGRIVFAIDYWVANARGWLLQAMTFTALAFEVAALVLIAWLAGCQRLRALVVFGALCVVLVFSPHTWENLVWGFQTPFVTAYAATAGAAASLALYAHRPTRWSLALTFGLAVLAIVSLSNGLLTPVLLAAMAWWLKLPRKVFWGFVILAAVAWPLFLLAPGGGAQGGDVGWKDLTTVFIYFLRYLGSQIANIFSQSFKIGGPLINSLDYGIAIGELIFIAALAAFGHVLFSRNRNPGVAAAAVLVLFALGTAGLTSLGRAVGFPPDQALSPRYAATGAVALAAIVIIAMTTLRMTNAWLVRAVLLGGLIVALATPVMALPLIRDLTNQQRGRLSAQTAFIADVRDNESIGMLTFDADTAFRLNRKLRADGKWLFEDPWSRKVGSDVSSEIAAAGTLETCPGTMQVTAAPAYLRLNGTVARRLTRRAKIVLLVDAGGRLAGYGVVPRRASDLSPLGMDGTFQVDWQGHARPDSRAPLTAYLAAPDAIACRIGAQPAG